MIFMKKKNVKEWEARMAEEFGMSIKEIRQDRKHWLTTKFSKSIEIEFDFRDIKEELMKSKVVTILLYIYRIVMMFVEVARRIKNIVTIVGSFYYLKYYLKLRDTLDDLRHRH